MRRVEEVGNAFLVAFGRRTQSHISRKNAIIAVTKSA
jgi:hypothetical protein